MWSVLSIESRGDLPNNDGLAHKWITTVVLLWVVGIRGWRYLGHFPDYTIRHGHHSTSVVENRCGKHDVRWRGQSSPSDHSRTTRLMPRSVESRTKGLLLVHASTSQQHRSFLSNQRQLSPHRDGATRFTKHIVNHPLASNNR